MHQSSPRDVGMEVHQASLAVASVANAHHAEVVSLGTSGTRQGDIDHRLRRLHSNSPPRVLVDAAGPCGDGRYRDRTHQGHVCGGVAPSVLPHKPGDRVKTHRRDAINRARLMRSGDLTPVYVPTVEDDAIRDLGRARAEASRALKTATLRLTALLRRQALRDTGRATWSPAPRSWRRAVVWPTAAPQLVFPADVRAVTEQPEPLARLEQELTAQVQTWRLAPVVDALQALRGIQCTVAVTTVAARGDLSRFETPRQLMPYPGFTPAASSPGARRRQGSSTKAGHPPARRALIEGAWASRDPATVSRHRQLRLEQRPKPIQELRGQAQVRLCRRDRPRSARGQNPQQVVVAMARALRACMGAMAQQVPRTPERLRRSWPWRAQPQDGTGQRQRCRPGLVSSSGA
jgi:transposase